MRPEQRLELRRKVEADDHLSLSDKAFIPKLASLGEILWCKREIPVARVRGAR
jgi:hypothetical protein